VTTLPGTHLHLLKDPDEVATELLALIGQLGIDPSPAADTPTGAPRRQTSSTP